MTVQIFRRGYETHFNVLEDKMSNKILRTLRDQDPDKRTMSDYFYNKTNLLFKLKLKLNIKSTRKLFSV